MWRRIHLKSKSLVRLNQYQPVISQNAFTSFSKYQIHTEIKRRVLPDEFLALKLGGFQPKEEMKTPKLSEIDVVLHYAQNITYRSTEPQFMITSDKINYIEELFQHLNQTYFKLDGQTITKAYLAGQILLYKVNLDDNFYSLKESILKFVMRTQRMLLSNDRPSYYALIFKQQQLLLKSSQSQIFQSGELQSSKVHPLRKIWNFIFQNTVFDETEGVLGPESWPTDIKFKIQDITRLFESLNYVQEFSYSDQLFKTFTKILLEIDKDILNDEADRSWKVEDILSLVESCYNLTKKGKDLKHLDSIFGYSLKKLLANLDLIKEQTQILKSLSIVSDYIVKRKLSSPKLLQILEDSLMKQLLEKGPDQMFNQFHLERLVKFASNDKLAMDAISLSDSNQFSLEVAIAAKLRYDLDLPAKKAIINDDDDDEDFINSQIKELILKGDSQSLIAIFESEEVHFLLRKMRKNEESFADMIKNIAKKGQVKKKLKSFAELSNSSPEEDEQYELYIDLMERDELETLSLFIYGLCLIDKQVLNENRKVHLVVNLIYDILHYVMEDLDPWHAEYFILKAYECQLLNEKLGATGEKLYDLTERFVVENWTLFSDEFRDKYRHEIYED